MESIQTLFLNSICGNTARTPPHKRCCTARSAQTVIFKSHLYFSSLHSTQNLTFLLYSCWNGKTNNTDTKCSFVNRTFLFYLSFVFNQITVIYLLRWPPAAAWTTWSKCILLELSEWCCNRKGCGVWCLSGRGGFSAGLKKKEERHCVLHM